MVGAINKKLLMWYLITLKLRETLSDALTRSFKLHKRSYREGEKFVEAEWKITISEKLENARKDDKEASWGHLSIYRVPRYLRKGDDQGYFPTVVSLGPYHHGEHHLCDMEPHKWRAFYRILKRCNQNFEVYFDSVRRVEAKARACYEGPINFSSKAFIEMMIVDGCFLLELFQGAKKGFEDLGYLPNDPVFKMRGQMPLIQRDVIMLENQIPMFILDRLFGLQIGQPNQKGLVGKLVHKFLHPLVPAELSTETLFNPFLDKAYLHCLHVFRQTLVRAEYKRSFKRYYYNLPLYVRGVVPTHKSGTNLTYSVTKLLESGIQFKVKDSDVFGDIKFAKGTLHLPLILIHDGTRSLFRNVIAFEQCHLDSSHEITAFLVFLNSLIHSPQDVEHLRDCGIVDHWLRSDAEVVDLLGQLSQDVTVDINGSYLAGLAESINSYHDLFLILRWGYWRMILIRDYCNSPWALISFVAGMVLLLLTFAQTFYGVYGYYRPSS